MEGSILIKKHLYKLCELAHKEGLDKVFVHAFTDGRDCDPQSGKGFIQALEKNLYGAKIVFGVWSLLCHGSRFTLGANPESLQSTNQRHWPALKKSCK